MKTLEIIEGLNNCLDELEKERNWIYVYVNDKNIKLDKVRNWLNKLKTCENFDDHHCREEQADENVENVGRETDIAHFERTQRIGKGRYNGDREPAVLTAERNVCGCRAEEDAEYGVSHDP